MSRNPFSLDARLERERQQASDMATKELQARLALLEMDERMAIVWLARWYEKWSTVAGPRKIGRTILELAKTDLNEVHYE